MATNNDQPICITVDAAETRSLIPDYLKELGVTVKTEALLAADYAFSGVGVERKSAEDFAASILDRRLFGQIEMVKAEYENPVVLVEGDIYQPKFGITTEAMNGAISYIAMLSNIKIIYTKDPRMSAHMLFTMARHLQNGLGYEVPLRGGKPKDLKSLAQYLVEGMPGVGPGTAKVLLKYFGSPYAVFTASKEDMLKVKGVGPKTIDKMYSIIHFGRTE